MPFSNLRSFLTFLEQKGDLHRIKTEVDPILEITEIATRIGKRKGPALLFENVKGSKFPLLINVLGAERRVAWALGKDPKELGAELGGLATDIMPPSIKKLWDHRSTLKRLVHLKPSRSSSGSVLKNCISPADLDRLPVAQSWPKDGGRFITFPLVVTKSPEDGKQNMGVYRMHVYGKDQTGMHWQIAKGGGYHYQQAEHMKQPLPVSVVLGADPVLMMCGVLPLPEGLDEMTFAGFLRGQATKTTKLSTPNHIVPSESEFILQGYVPPFERRMEGPYGDHFGHYSLAAEFPVFHIEKIWHRDDPIFPIAVVGKPPQEDQVIGDAVQEILLPLLKVMHPEIKDLWAYQEAGFHNLIVASVHERFQKEALKTGFWILGEGQLALSKCVVLVDESVNARNFNEVLAAIRKNFDPSRDFVLLPQTSQDTLDFTSYKMNLGSKMIIDATGSLGKNSVSPVKPIEWTQVQNVDSSIKEVLVLADTMLVIRVKGKGREILEKMLSFPSINRYKIVVTVSEDIPLDDPVLLLWGIFTRFDCARDTFFSSVVQKNSHPSYQGSLFIDATWKEGYPEPLTMTSEIVQLVDRKWNDYGFKD